MLGLWLSGCAYSPGIKVGSPEDAEAPRPNSKLGAGADTGQTNWPSWLHFLGPEKTTGGPVAAAVPAAQGQPAGVATAAPAASVSETPPPGALMSITPDLVRKLRGESAAVDTAVQALFGEPQPYRIGVGDVLGIFLWSHPELNLPPAAAVVSADGSVASGAASGYTVNTEGSIQFPYLGVVKVVGKSELQVRDEMARGLTRFLKDPQLMVRIQNYRSARVYVDGEVRSPGLQSITDQPMTLPEVLNRAGGLTAAADRSAVAVTREGRTTLVNLVQLAEAGVNPSRILLRAGDLVRVLSREDSRVFVMGEVTRPIALSMRSNGRMSLGDALGEAGGVSQTTGDPRQVYVVRNGAAGNPEVYHLDASRPTAFALAAGFELRPRDVVFVDPSDLVRWNRVISLILPSAQALNTTRIIVENK